MTAKSFLPTALCAFVIAFQQIQNCVSAESHFNDGINESNIIEIDDENFQQAVNSTKYALVSVPSTSTIYASANTEPLILIYY